jgi:hypothetical protein
VVDGVMRARSIAWVVAVLSCAGCASSNSSAQTACGAGNLLVAANADTSSELGVLALDGGQSFASSEALGSDPALAASHGRVFWINRTIGSIIELDPKCDQAIGGPWLVNEGATGSSNPQDVAVAPDGRLWVARFDVPSVSVLSADGKTQVHNIDLSGPSGRANPYMNSIRIITLPGGAAKAYASLEMLAWNADGKLVADGPSYVARIDVATQRFEKLLALEGQNPFGLMVEYDSALYLAEPGDWSKTNETTAGIERVDLASFTSKLIVRESDIGASVAQVSVASGTCATAIVADGSSNNYTSLISFNPKTQAIVTAKGFLYTSAGYELEGMAWLDGGINVIGDRTGVAGKGFAVHVLEASSSCALSARSESLYVPQSPIAFQPTP